LFSKAFCFPELIRSSGFFILRGLSSFRAFGSAPGIKRP
jgi:hypothetical protein